ncbi:Pentatricopeptide repeat-containing protein [Seminavis robusta]|uniref:Pentatricopeptide repeat-containing protein n=1 Tax=Seminavis robusta TaxID=568900 RepID=A0A9N8HJN4_9STRA|nr:Pentatricopeptide repeat-containing protein [Seminavis robusta]|eukprot:Sro673_g185320.1 Pentatricopeptide repeat-containing protein (571) ;mRNA; f:45434-47493
MTRRNRSWPAAAALLIIIGTVSKPSNAFTTSIHTRLSSHTSSSMALSVAMSPPVQADNSSTSGGDNNNNNDNQPEYKDLREANKALDALAMKCGNPTSEPIISRADECQSQWENMRGSSIEPDTVSFNTVLKAWGRCCHSLAEIKRNSANGGDDTAVSFTADDGGVHNDHPQVYTAKDAAERATLLLLSQEQEYENGSVPESARPDTYSYNEAIGAWAKSGVAEAPQNAERLLKRMLDHEYIRPDGISYNSVVDAWAYSGRKESIHKLVEEKNYDEARKTARDAEEYLTLMKERYEQTQDPDHMPDVMTYTAAMDTYGRCGHYTSTMRARALLEELKDLYEESGNPKLKPGVRTYTSLITAWSKTRSPDSTRYAEQLLEEMNNSGDTDLYPNARTYTAVIQAWGRSPDHNKAARSLKLLQALKERHNAATSPSRKQALKPTLSTYNNALEACARCQGDLAQQTAALKIAFAILKAVNQKESGLQANAVTYATVLRACSFLLGPGAERNTVATAVFEKAKKAGMADFRVLFQLRKTVDSKQLAELLDGLPQDRNGIFDFNKAPPGWSRNVR